MSIIKCQWCGVEVSTVSYYAKHILGKECEGRKRKIDLIELLKKQISNSTERGSILIYLTHEETVDTLRFLK